MKLTFFFSLLCSIAYADSPAFDAFYPPSDAMKNTHYTNDCGGVSEDFSADMPPVDNQSPSNWCATFASRALLEYSAHKANANDTYSNRYSAVDLNSWRTDRAADVRGKFLGMGEGASPFVVLEGAQSKGELYADHDLPFDQNLFDKSYLLQRLSNYYDEEKPFADANVIECRDQTPEDKSLESLFATLPGLLSQSATKTSFLENADATYSIISTPKAGAVRQSVSPPFNIRRFDTATGDQLMEEIQKNIKQKNPVILDICADQLLKDPVMLDHLVPPPYLNSCGSHAIVITGMQKIGGICQVKFRNSWGSDWPTTADGGYASIPASQLLSILDTKNGLANLESISSRNQNDPVQNQIIQPNFSYQGETWQAQPNGKGHLSRPDGTVEDGDFKNGTFISGQMKTTLSDGAKYQGSYQNGAISGQGHLVQANGAVLDGIFQDGRLMSGHFTGIINDSTGLYYDGPMLDGHTTSDGTFSNTK